MAITFSVLREEHLADIVAIYNWYALNSTATFHTTEVSIEEMRSILIFDHPKFGAFVIQDEGQVIGYCGLMRFKPRQAYDITAESVVYLKPESIRKGIGTQAVAFLEDTARSRGMHSLLATVTSENANSIKMLEKCGYSSVAHYKEVGVKFGKLLDVDVLQKFL